jgi:hypothetical protein
MTPPNPIAVVIGGDGRKAAVAMCYDILTPGIGLPTKGIARKKVSGIS